MVLKDKPRRKLGAKNEDEEAASKEAPASTKGMKRTRLNSKSHEDLGDSKKQRTNDGSKTGEAASTVNVADIKEISQKTRQALQTKGISSLFEIQQKAFQPCFTSKDVVGRAKTGCGKTLAFVLPTVERICAGKLTKTKDGRRLPASITVAPTRELARQIYNDFDLIGSASGLKVACFYGGTPFGPQCDSLRSGVDILICTPGRLLDHIRRETVDLSGCCVLILDEADEMLSMGFQEDVDSIMQAVPQENVQKLLFSATLPKWVNALVEKHLKDPVWIDVTHSDPNATNSKIKHKCISCPPSLRGDCVADLCKVHAGMFGKTLVFTDTKKECDELASNEKLVSMGAAALHGDIGQSTRDSVMENFRCGRIKCLVATDVAARGLDVPNVDLVIQTHPSSDLDKYVHRAGRTARAGREGTNVVFYALKEEYIIRLLEHKKGIKMQRIGPPQPIDVVRAAATDVATQLDHVHQDSVDAFMDTARDLIAERGADVALAASLAALGGHTRKMKGRSLLSSFEGYTAVQISSDRTIETTSKGWYFVRNLFSWDISEAARGLTLVEGGHSFIFEVPDDMLPRVKDAALWKGMTLTIPTTLPELQARDCNIRQASQQLKEWKQSRWHGGKSNGKGKDDFRESGSGRGGAWGGRGGGRGGDVSKGVGRGRGGRGGRGGC